MDWGTFAKLSLTTIGGTTAILLLIGFLGKNWIGTRITESIKNLYAKELEKLRHDNAKELADFKVQLEQQNLNEQEQLSADKRVFDAFLKVLPSNGSIGFIREHDFAGPFDRSRLDQLWTFEYQWTDAEHEFLNSAMETKRNELHQLISSYHGVIARNTWPLDGESGNTFSGVPREWAEKQPQRLRAVIDSLHEQAGKVVGAHQELIRMGRSYLKY